MKNTLYILILSYHAAITASLIAPKPQRPPKIIDLLAQEEQNEYELLLQNLKLITTSPQSSPKLRKSPHKSPLLLSQIVNLHQ